VKPDPIFSGDALKAVLLLVVAVVIGGGALAIATGNLDVNLPDINLPDTGNTGTTVTLQNTDLSNTTIDPSTEPVAAPKPQTPVGDPFSSAGLAQAIATLKTEAGAGAELTSLTVNETQTQFIVRRGKGIVAYSVRADDGSLGRQDASVSITGNATIGDFAFKLDAVKPPAVDRMLAQTRKLSGAAGLRPTVLRLERDLTAGLRPPEWTINAEGGGRYLTYRANANGGGVKNVGGQGVPIPQGAIDARKLTECIKGAGTETEAIRKCFADFSP
jgi:hypothetical protein